MVCSENNYPKLHMSHHCLDTRVNPAPNDEREIITLNSGDLMIEMLTRSHRETAHSGNR